MSSKYLAKKAALMATAMILVWLGGFIFFYAYISLIKPPADSLYSEAAVVLTGGPHRINEGFDILDAGSTDTVFISGVDARVTKDMLFALWRSDTDQSTRPCCIVLGHVATNTAENATEAAQWVNEHGVSSIRLITSEYHIPRAWLEFSNALPETEIIIHPVMSAESMLDFLRLAFVEYNKTLLTFFRHMATS